MELLDEIDATMAAGHSRAAMLLALMVPDHAAALSAVDGRTDRHRYAAWFNANMTGGYLEDIIGEPPGSPWLSGEDCYRYRCTLLHQSIGVHKDARFRLSFSDSNHFGIINDVLVLHLPTFVSDMTSSARAWLEVAGKQDWIVYRNLQTRLRVLPGGSFGGVKYGDRVFL